MTDRIRLLYVANFRNVHARTFIEHFAARAATYDITVLSTFPAEPMSGVRLVELDSEVEAPRNAASSSRIAPLVVKILETLPQLLVFLRRQELTWQTLRTRRRVRRLVDRFDPEIVHAFRAQPEAVAAREFERAAPRIPFVVSTWGQDFVLMSPPRTIMRRLVRETISVVDLLLPDNPRDERLARDEFQLPAEARSVVLPATGGVDLSLLAAAAAEEPPALGGAPRLFSVRGYENSYIRIRVLLKAFRLFLERFPDAHLYVDVNQARRDPARDEQTRKWIRAEGVEEHTTLLHLDRAGVFGYMRSCDLYVSATLSDGLPMSLIESLYFGMIPVVRDHESTRAAVGRAAAAEVFDEIEPRGIARAWIAAMQQSSSREERVAANRPMILEHYAREPNLERVEDLYSDLLGRNPRPCRSS